MPLDRCHPSTKQDCQDRDHPRYRIRLGNRVRVIVRVIVRVRVRVEDRSKYY